MKSFDLIEFWDNTFSSVAEQSTAALTDRGFDHRTEYLYGLYIPVPDVDDFACGLCVYKRFHDTEFIPRIVQLSSVYEIYGEGKECAHAWALTEGNHDRIQAVNWKIIKLNSLDVVWEGQT